MRSVSVLCVRPASRVRYARDETAFLRWLSESIAHRRRSAVELVISVRGHVTIAPLVRYARDTAGLRQLRELAAHRRGSALRLVSALRGHVIPSSMPAALWRVAPAARQGLLSEGRQKGGLPFLKFTTLYLIHGGIEYHASHRPADGSWTLVRLFSSPSQPLVRGRIPYGTTANLTE